MLFVTKAVKLVKDNQTNVQVAINNCSEFLMGHNANVRMDILKIV